MTKTQTPPTACPPESKPQKNKGGRPRIENKRDKRISIRLTEDERRDFAMRALQSNLTLTEAVRLLMLSEPLPEKVFGGLDIGAAKAYQNLQPLQANLNQIAHHLNARTDATIKVDQAKKLVALVRAIEQEVKELRAGIVDLRATSGEPR